MASVILASIKVSSNIESFTRNRTIKIMDTKLYTMLTRDRETGEETVIYGTVTENVISSYWVAYVSDQHDVIIREVLTISREIG